MPLCKLCGADKDADEFYKSNKSTCKECVRDSVRRNRLKRAEYYKEYDRKRFQNDPKVRERHKRYQATDAGKMSMLRSRIKWRQRFPERRAAHVMLGNAVRDGKVSKPSACERCGLSNGRIHGHHEDYSKPLDVVWVCPWCHHEIHNQPMHLLRN